MVAVLDTWLARRRIEACGACGAWRRRAEPRMRATPVAIVLTVACAPVVVEPDGPAVTPSRVIGQTGLETRLEASERSGFTLYVGREAHLARLERDVDSAHRGNGRVIEIVGDAGVGKSRLVYELRERLSATGATALQGRCRAFGDVAPYCPFIEIVRGAL